MPYYNFISRCYADLDDLENARKYYDMIVKESPNLWYLNNLKEKLERINK